MRGSRECITHAHVHVRTSASSMLLYEIKYAVLNGSSIIELHSFANCIVLRASRISACDHAPTEIANA